MSIPFTKMHGLGNDIVVIDLVRDPALNAVITADLVRAIGDRKTGIGFDQLMLIDACDDERFEAAYRIFNSDGSRALQCGNGVRCVAAYLADRKPELSQRSFSLSGPTGAVECTVLDAQSVRVTMGEPSFDPKTLPFENGAQPGPVYSLETSAGPGLFVALSVGNPHAVVMVDDVRDAPVATIGAALNEHAAFPEGVNVGFAQVVNESRLNLRVFERGVGETRACGSGACAAMVAMHRRGLVADSVQVDLPGGSLVISWRADSGPIEMTGPVATVFEGNLTT